MLRRRILYLICLIGCFGFFIGYRGWLAWMFLLSVICLPWLSLLLSLPFMLCMRVRFRFPSAVMRGEKLRLTATPSSKLPLTPTSWRYSIQEQYSGEQRKYAEDKEVYAKHCGCLHIRVKRAWKYDFLGLFRLPISGRKQASILVRPTPVPVAHVSGLNRYMAGRWVPKQGGGFSENHDLRLYRPGDDLRLVHWKLAAKTGKIVLREPIVPCRGKLVLTMLLCGSAEVLDEKLGKLCYLSDMLLQKELPHELHCLTADGLFLYEITTLAQLHAAIDALLCAKPTQERSMPHIKAALQYRIGGEHDEA